MDSTQITLKVTQCQVGQFNLLSNENSLSFYMGIIKDGKIIEEDGVRAQLCFSGDPDEYDTFEDAFGNLDYVFEKCWKYANNIISSANYKKQCLLFAKVYRENYEEINNSLLKEHKEKTERKIKELQHELEWNMIVPEEIYSFNSIIKKEIKKHQDWIESNNKKMLDLKEESESYRKLQKQNESYLKDIEEYSKLLDNE